MCRLHIPTCRYPRWLAYLGHRAPRREIVTATEIIRPAQRDGVVRDLAKDDIPDADFADGPLGAAARDINEAFPDLPKRSNHPAGGDGGELGNTWLL